MGKTINLKEIGERNAADFLREVARAHETLCVVLEDGEIISIDPSAPPLPAGEAVPPLTLKPLTVLSGYVPAGWKEAIYDFSDSES